MKKILTIVLLIILLILGYFFSPVSNTIYDKEININDKIEVYRYTSNGPIIDKLKKDINKSKYIDFIQAGLSDNKAKQLENLITLYGSINNMSVIKNIPKFTKQDYERIIGEFSIDNSNIIFNKIKINELDYYNLRYLGLSSKEANKILDHLKTSRIWNEKDLRGLINKNSFEKIKGYIIY